MKNKEVKETNRSVLYHFIIIYLSTLQIFGLLRLFD